MYNNKTIRPWPNFSFNSADWAGSGWWDTPPIKGFEWYDTFTSTILSNVTFKGYKHFDFPAGAGAWWRSQTPSAFRMLSHSDLFKPGEEEILCFSLLYGGRWGWFEGGD